MGVGWQCLRWVCFPRSGFLVGYFSSIYQLNKIKKKRDACFYRYKQKLYVELLFHFILFFCRGKVVWIQCAYMMPRHGSWCIK